MCGIFGYSGSGSVKEILLTGLKKLEYRGYDSAGIALNRGGEHRGSEFTLYKSVGGVDELRDHIATQEATQKATQEQRQVQPDYSYAIGHTRWATHGEVTVQNAHPHMSYDSALALVHNGIIENYLELRRYLESKGIQAKSDTDSELLVHCISYHYAYLQEHEPNSQETNVERLTRAMLLTSEKLVGSYAILLACRYIPDTFFALCEGAQLLVSHSNGEVRVSSDRNALFAAGSYYVTLGDGELAVINKTDINVQDKQRQSVAKAAQELSQEFGVAEKGAYDTYMLKEIHEHPRAVRQALAGRINYADATAQLSGFNFEVAQLRAYRAIKILSMGTSYYAAQVGAMWLEAIAKIPASAEMAAEFVGREPVLSDDTLYIVISQSGETYDTLNSVKLIRQHGIKVYGICNVVGSRIARMTDGGCYTHSGPEIAVASTKVFSGQLAILAALTLKIARVHNMGFARGQELIKDLEKVAPDFDAVLNDKLLLGSIQKLAQDLVQAPQVLFLGRGHSYHVAQEAALKFKELCYQHASAYSASELKHGPIALVDEYTHVVVFAEDGAAKQKIFSTVQEIRARKGRVYLCGVAESTAQEEHAKPDKNKSAMTVSPKTAAFSLPYLVKGNAISTPFVHGLVAHLLAYYSAKAKGTNIDKPRNLAKSVTVE